MTSPPITFAIARDFAMWFGQHHGKRLDTIAESDDGLLYLDWMRGELDRCASRTTRQQVVLDHLTVYLDDQTMALEVIRAHRKREARHGR